MIDAAREVDLLPGVDVVAPREFVPDAKQILEIHFKLHGTDGVSLVAHSLDSALEKLGRNIHRLSGDVLPRDKGLNLAGISYQSPEAISLRQRIFSEKPDPNLKTEIETAASRLRPAIEQYIKDNNIGTVIIRNLFSLPLNLPATLALYQIMREPAFQNVKFALFHHDFYWEKVRSSQYVSGTPEIEQMISNLYPPTLPNVRHFVINSGSQKELWERKGIKATILPDAYDFEKAAIDFSIPVERSFPLRKKLGLKPEDLMVIVPTRVVGRKAIELAIRLVAEMAKPANRDRLVELSSNLGGIGRLKTTFSDTSKIVLVLPQAEDIKDNGKYLDHLKTIAKKLGVDLKPRENMFVLTVLVQWPVIGECLFMKYTKKQI